MIDAVVICNAPSNTSNCDAQLDTGWPRLGEMTIKAAQPIYRFTPKHLGLAPVRPTHHEARRLVRSSRQQMVRDAPRQVVNATRPGLVVEEVRHA